MRIVAFLLLAGLVLDPQPTLGQAVADSLVGERVRLHMSQQDRRLEGYVARQQVRGTLLRLHQDSVAIRMHPEATPVSVAENGIYQIDVSRGVRRARTAIRRAAQGALIWGAMGALGDREFGGGDLENALIWAGGGVVFGTVLGAAFPEEHWTRVFRR